MARRYYSSVAAATTLAAGVTSGATTLTVTAVAGFPGSFPYTLVVDPDTSAEEVVTVTSAAGTTLTVTRGQDGTSAVSHSAGAVVRHGVSARDFDEPNAHVNASAAVHGLTGTVVGTTDTQTLTNKTLTSPTISGTPVRGAWTSWTPTFTNITSGAGQFFYRLRDDKTLEFRAYFTAGTATATAPCYFTLPASKTSVASAQQAVTALTSAGTLYAVVPSADTRVGMQSQTLGQSLVGYTFNGVIEVQ